MNYPRQGSFLNKAVYIAPKYLPKDREEAVCVRDDLEEPFLTLFLDKRGKVFSSLEVIYRDLRS